jgi:hypothetical protein
MNTLRFKTVRWTCIALITLALLASGSLGCGRGAQPQTSKSPPPGMTTQILSIVNGALLVTAGGQHDVPFSLSGQDGVRLSGWAHATGNSVIQVVVLDSSDYDSWNQGRSVRPIYNSGQTVRAEFDVGIPSAYGNYHIVIVNAWSKTLTTVQADIELTYLTAIPSTPSP